MQLLTHPKNSRAALLLPAVHVAGLIPLHYLDMSKYDIFATLTLHCTIQRSIAYGGATQDVVDPHAAAGASATAMAPAAGEAEPERHVRRLERRVHIAQTTHARLQERVTQCPVRAASTCTCTLTLHTGC